MPRWPCSHASIKTVVPSARACAPNAVGAGYQGLQRGADLLAAIAELGNQHGERTALGSAPCFRRASTRAMSPILACWIIRGIASERPRVCAAPSSDMSAAELDERRGALAGQLADGLQPGDLPTSGSGQLVGPRVPRPWFLLRKSAGKSGRPTHAKSGGSRALGVGGVEGRGSAKAES